MKRRLLSFSSLIFAATWLIVPAAFGQSPAAATDAGAVPAGLSIEAKAQYEAQMKTLRAQIDAEKWQEALTTAEAMNKERPREPQARFLKTIVLTELGRDDEAQRELLTLVADYPELPEPHNNLATLYARKGEYGLAQRELELALTAAPDYGIAHANLADLYLQQAIEHYRRAAALTKVGKESKALLTRADSVQSLLAPAGQPDKAATLAKKTNAAAKDEKADKKANEKTTAKEGDPKEGDFLSAGCEAPAGFGGEGKGDDVFTAGGTCEIDFDEPAPEKAEGGKAPSPVKTP